MKILSDKNPLDVFCEASSILNDAVEHTIGPKGTNTAIQTNEGHYEIINDGKAIIERITSLEPDIAPALETLKQASFETNRKAGDGTTSTVVIMNELLQGARDYLKNNPEVSPVELRVILEDFKNRLLEQLSTFSKDLTEEDYVKVAKVALGGDTYAEDIAYCYKFLEGDGRPTLLKSDIEDVELEEIDGISLEKSRIVSSLFINAEEYRDIDVVCLFEPINRFQELTQLLKRVQQTQRVTLLFYNELSADILENLLFNFTNGALKLIPVCLGGYGKKTYGLMEELADYTGCSVIDNSKVKLNQISQIIFGSAEYGIVNKEKIVLKNSKKVSKNYLHLTKRSIIIRVGGTNKIQREEVYRRIEDAVNSLGNAISLGIVPGAGKAYHDLAELVLADTYSKGIEIPLFITTSMNKIQKLVSAVNTKDIYDSTRVVFEVITNAFSIVSQVITTNRIIHENIR